MNILMELLGLLLFGSSVWLTVVMLMRIREMSATTQMKPVAITLILSWVATAAVGGWFA